MNKTAITTKLKRSVNASQRQDGVSICESIYTEEPMSKFDNTKQWENHHIFLTRREIAVLAKRYPETIE